MAGPQYFVHYTVLDPKGEDKVRGFGVRRLVAGPYTMDEAFAKRRDLDNGSAMNVYINEDSTCSASLH